MRAKAIVVATTMALIGASAGPIDVAAIRTSRGSREAYLAHATIWQTPPALSTTELFDGPPGAFPYTVEEATSDEGIACTFAQAGKELGGNSPKFLCRTADGRSLRLKYWDPRSRSGSHEVFATVAASRLMWALGFEAVPSLPMNVRCDGCPENPMKGTGLPGTRRYDAMSQAFWPTPSILSGEDLDQGWSWQELGAAIRSLPPGAERTRQRTQFDALTLLGVFLQHGDRKAEQQRLYCAASFDAASGDLQMMNGHTTMLFERPGAMACPTSAVTILDTGATFGGGGRASRESTAKMNLEAWQESRVFKTNEGAGCRGHLTVSLKARDDGEPNPIISEQGRRFLSEQLHRLTSDHVRAIFRAARVDELDDPRHGSASRHGIEAWVSAFEDKVRQIDAQRCQPFN